MDLQQVYAKTRDQMQKALNILQTDLSTIRTGRANPAFFQNLRVAVYGGGQQLTLAELATLTTQDARTLLILPFDPTIIEEINKGIMGANLGVTSVIEGERIRVIFPPLTEERREEYVKLAKAKLEGGRIMVRQIRKDGMSGAKKMEENGEIGEDDRFRAEKEIQKITDEINGHIELLGSKKEEELKSL